MQRKDLIAVNEFCLSHNIEISFVSSLQQSGLIEIATRDGSLFIPAGHLKQLETMVHFYYELDINMEGIETINHLLQRITSLQDEIISLKNRLRLYEKTD
jgi:hypothetical protein